ncbi:hypothetical protein [Wolbachia endosymbiont (group A) of Tiphia femorata]|nr:hypothetical protein [Wolbachia endosymbiont (group A) of Tiphia femorata]
MSGQHLYDVIQVAFFSCHPSVSYSDDTLLNRHTAIHSRYLKA